MVVMEWEEGSYEEFLEAKCRAMVVELQAVVVELQTWKDKYNRDIKEIKYPAPTLSGYKLQCLSCGKQVSTTLPKSTIVRAIITCPECYEKE
jgi:DNA-directed RNA polymerase subunit RPC12/RpoP